MLNESQDKSSAINRRSIGKNKGITKNVRGSTEVARVTSKEQLYNETAKQNYFAQEIT